MEVGNWMRSKETGKAVKIKSIGDDVIAYGNNETHGEVQIDRLSEFFDLLDDPSSRDDIECLLRAKIEAGEAETGLYDVGLSFVVADNVLTDGRDVVTFQWFEHAMPFNDVLLVD